MSDFMAGFFIGAGSLAGALLLAGWGFVGGYRTRKRSKR